MTRSSRLAPRNSVSSASACPRGEEVNSGRASALLMIWAAFPAKFHSLRRRRGIYGTLLAATAGAEGSILDQFDFLGVRTRDTARGEQSAARDCREMTRQRESCSEN